MVDKGSFLREVEGFRKIGAKYVTLKIGAYKTPDLVWALLPSLLGIKMFILTQINVIAAEFAVFCI